MDAMQYLAAVATAAQAACLNAPARLDALGFAWMGPIHRSRHAPIEHAGRLLARQRGQEILRNVGRGAHRVRGRAEQCLIAGGRIKSLQRA